MLVVCRQVIHGYRGGQAKRDSDLATRQRSLIVANGCRTDDALVCGSGAGSG